MGGPNYRILHLLDEDPLFLDLMDYPPILEYVRGPRSATTSAT